MKYALGILSLIVVTINASVINREESETFVARRESSDFLFGISEDAESNEIVAKAKEDSEAFLFGLSNVEELDNDIVAESRGEEDAFLFGLGDPLKEEDNSIYKRDEDSAFMFAY